MLVTGAEIAKIWRLRRLVVKLITVPIENVQLLNYSQTAWENYRIANKPNYLSTEQILSE